MMQRLTKILLLLLVLGSVNACEHKPIYMRFGGDEVSEDHSPDFQQGWRDGCDTGSAVYGNQVTKAFKGYTRDASKVGNRSYESAWIDAYNWCRQQHNNNINQWDNDWWGIFTLQ
jgi:hypothetical protein